MLVDDIRNVEVQLRTLSWLMGHLGKADLDEEYAYGLYLLGNTIADHVKTLENKIRTNNGERLNEEKN
jgi:hypothetical protein